MDEFGWWPIHYAVMNEDLDEISKILYKNHSMINACSSNGSMNNMTPLYMAAQKGNAKIVKYLLNEGANKDIKAKQLRTNKEISAE